VKHPADWLPLGVITLGVALAGLPLLVALPLAALVPLWFASLALRSVAPVHQHCHAHYAIFTSNLANAAYDVVLMLAGGNTTAVWELQHVLGHHQVYLEGARDPAYSRRFTPDGPWQRAIFTVLGDAASVRDAWRITAWRPANRRYRARLVRQVALQVAVLAALVAWQPAVALAFFVVPAVLLRWIVFWFSYAQHHGMPMHDVYSGSVTHFGWTNRWFLNVGHHTAHHEKPTLHWTRLPARTQQIVERIPSVCLR